MSMKALAEMEMHVWMHVFRLSFRDKVRIGFRLKLAAVDGKYALLLQLQ